MERMVLLLCFKLAWVSSLWVGYCALSVSLLPLVFADSLKPELLIRCKSGCVVMCVIPAV